MSEKSEKLLKDWLLHATRKAHAHVKCAGRSRFYRNLIGIPSVVLSAIVGTAVFAEIQNNADTAYKAWVIFAVLLAAVLTSLQTFFNFGEKEQAHLIAGKRYAQVRRMIEKNIALQLSSQKDLDAVEAALNDAKDIEPGILDSVWAVVESKWTLQSLGI